MAQSETQSASLSILPSVTDAPKPDATNAPKPTSEDNQDDDEETTEAAAKPNLSDITASANTKTSFTAAPKSTTASGFTTSTTSSTSSSASATPTIDPTADDIRTTDDWYKASEEKLPLQPRVSVAFGFGGALLITTGTLLAFVGIQHKLLYICLSTAYLVCLSITVLIIYVMNPPVSDAVQGAYLVGIVAPGLIFGGGAMVFSNLTEGLGCMLGGFTLSMWLLCLKAGGLLTNTTSIVIFICVFSAVVFSTAYVNFFQPYTLIFSLAFSGATAIVLGIDCFSRAGLKEFWVYIWRLNDDIFPLGTTNYPMTRGIKVEVAGIVVFTVLGILVQWKLWGFIRKKHKAKMEERAAERRALEREEEMIGRRVNWETSKQRERWEEVYHPDGSRIGPDGKAWQSSLGSDSGIADMSTKRADSHSTLGKKGVPQITVDEEAIEMAQLPTHSRTSSGAGSLSRRLSQIVYTTRGTDEGVHMVDTSRANARKSKDLGALAALEGDRARTSKRDSKSKRVSGSPDTPFPSLDAGGGDKRNSNRLSADSRGSRLLHRLSHNSSTDKRRSTSKKGLREGSDDDWDALSSIAATVDDLQSDFDFADLRSLPSGTPRVSMVLDKAINASDPDPALGDEPVDGNEASSDWTWKKKAKEADILHMAGPSKSLTKDVLPPAAPKVAATFRAEEWAKRLESAEAPIVPEIEQAVTPTKENFVRSSTEPPSPVSQTIPEGTVLESIPTKDDEAPAPVNIEALQQTAITGEVAPAPPRPRSAQPQPTMNMRPKSRDQNPWRSSMQPNSAGHSPDSSRPVTAQDVRERMAMKRSSSAGTLALPKQQHRVSSNPLQPLQEKDDDTMSLRQRQSILRQSSMPHFHGQRPTSAQQYPPELQHLAMDHRRQSELRMQPPPAPLPNRTSTPGYGNPFAMESINRGVPRPQQTDLEIMEQRRLQMLEERRMSQVKRTQEQVMAEQRDAAFADRFRMSVRQGDDAHREALRRMQGDAKVTP